MTPRRSPARLPCQGPWSPSPLGCYCPTWPCGRASVVACPRPSSSTATLSDSREFVNRSKGLAAGRGSAGGCAVQWCSNRGWDALRLPARAGREGQKTAAGEVSPALRPARGALAGDHEQEVVAGRNQRKQQAPPKFWLGPQAPAGSARLEQRAPNQAQHHELQRPAPASRPSERRAASVARKPSKPCSWRSPLLPSLGAVVLGCR